MKIVCLGGGPSGLYLAISMKLRNPAHNITVYERNRPGDTFGWGVVFSDETMENLKKNDPVSAQIMIDELVHWDMIDCHVNGEVERSDGHGFIGIGRKRMLQILHGRAMELGVNLEFEHEFEVSDIEDKFADADLIVAARRPELQGTQQQPGGLRLRYRPAPQQIRVAGYPPEFPGCLHLHF